MQIPEKQYLTPFGLPDTSTIEDRLFYLRDIPKGDAQEHILDLMRLSRPFGQLCGEFYIRLGQREIKEAVEALRLFKHAEGSEEEIIEQYHDLLSDVLYFQNTFDFTVWEYFVYGFEDKGTAERQEFLAERSRMRYYEQLNRVPEDVSNIANNKYNTWLILKPWYKRDMVQLRGEDDKAEFLAFAGKHARFIIKPEAGSLGKGITILNTADYPDTAALWQEASFLAPAVCEELIDSHESLASFHPASVNSIRVYTYFDGHEVHPMHAMFRAGQGGSLVDNRSAGGFAVSVDIETGIINSDARDEFNQSCAVHPDSGITFRGFQIPQWEDMIRTATELARELPTLPLVGWDLALSKDRGWQLIEANARGMFNGIQVPTRVGVARKYVRLLDWENVLRRSADDGFANPGLPEPAFEEDVDLFFPVPTALRRSLTDSFRLRDTFRDAYGGYFVNDNPDHAFLRMASDVIYKATGTRPASPAAEPGLLADMLYSNQVLGFSFEEYFAYGFAKMPISERQDYLSAARLEACFEALDNAGAARRVYTTHSRAWELVQPLCRRENMTVRRRTDRAAFMAFCARNPEFTVTSRTITLEFTEKDTSKPDELYHRLRNRIPYICTVPPTRHAITEELGGSCSVRVFTYTDQNGTRCLWPVLRTQSGIHTLIAAIDVETGTVRGVARDIYGRSYPYHPDTGLRFDGLKLPKWSKMLELARACAAEFPGLPFTGWEVVPDAGGQWQLTDTLVRSAAYEYQIAAGRGLTREMAAMIGATNPEAAAALAALMPIPSGSAQEHFVREFTLSEPFRAGFIARARQTAELDEALAFVRSREPDCDEPETRAGDLLYMHDTLTFSFDEYYAFDFASKSLVERMAYLPAFSWNACYARVLGRESAASVLAAVGVSGISLQQYQAENGGILQSFLAAADWRQAVRTRARYTSAVTGDTLSGVADDTIAATEEERFYLRWLPANSKQRRLMDLLRVTETFKKAYTDYVIHAFHTGQTISSAAQAVFALAPEKPETPEEIEALLADVIYCDKVLGFSPEEYFRYGLRGRTMSERLGFLSRDALQKDMLETILIEDLNSLSSLRAFSAEPDAPAAALSALGASPRVRLSACYNGTDCTGVSAVLSVVTGAGELSCAVDPDTGVLLTDAMDASGATYPANPESGILYRGFCIPRWRGLLTLAGIRAADYLPVPLICWDAVPSDAAEGGWEILSGDSCADTADVQSITKQPMLKDFAGRIELDARLRGQRNVVPLTYSEHGGVYRTMPGFGTVLDDFRSKKAAKPKFSAGRPGLPLRVIGKKSFAESRITEVEVPDGVQTLQFGAFMRCKKLAAVSLPDSLQYIGRSAFNGCASLERIRIPDGVMFLEKMAFAKCPNLTQLAIPESVRSIEPDAFFESPNIRFTVLDGSYAHQRLLEILHEELHGNIHCSEKMAMPPAEPASIAASACESGIRITWSAARRADTYRVFRREKGGKFVRIAEDIAVTDYLDTAAVSSVPYTYALRSVRGPQTSALSAARASAMFAVPAAITSLEAENTDEGIALRWNASAGAQLYTLFRCTEESEWTLLAECSGTAYLDDSPEKATEYFYKLIAVNGSLRSPESPVVTAVWGAPPKVESLTASVTSGGILLHWEPVELADSYRIYRRRPDQAEKWKILLESTTDTEYCDTSAEPEVRYEYTLRAYHGNQRSWLPNTYTAAAIAVPENVTVTSAAPAENGIRIDWKPVPNAPAFDILRCLASDRRKPSVFGIFRRHTSENWETVAQNITGSFWVDASAEEGTLYQYAVIGVNGELRSRSYVESAPAILAAPDNITDIKAVRNENGVLLTWGPVKHAVSYRVYRRPAGEKHWKTLTSDAGKDGWLDTDARSDIVYQYTVRGMNGTILSPKYKVITLE